MSNSEVVTAPQVGRQEPVMVLRVDKDKGYIDLSKRCAPFAMLVRDLYESIF